MKTYYVYILASKKHGVLYTGVTSSLPRRIYQHKKKKIVGFTQKYNVNKLVYYEATTDVWKALKREKLLKRWRRRWKISLVEHFNPEWKDLYFTLN